MNEKRKEHSAAHWGRHAVACLVRTFNCPAATLQTCQDILQRRDDPILTASTALTGGVAGHGSTCGLVLGGALGLALAYEAELAANGPNVEPYVVTKVRDYVCWFEDSFGSTRCDDITNADLSRPVGLLAFIVPGHKLVRCMSHIYAATKYLHQAMLSDLSGTALAAHHGDSSLHCAKAVLEQVRSMTGLGDPVLERASIGLDGGIGITGGACGALTGAVLAVSLAKGGNLRTMSTPEAYAAFLTGLLRIWSRPSEEAHNSFELSNRLTTRFEAEHGSIECREITSEKFDNWQSFQVHLRSSKKCRDILHFAGREAVRAINLSMNAA